MTPHRSRSPHDRRTRLTFRGPIGLKKAVAFGANFEGTNFNLSKVFVDNETKLENKQADQAKLFNAATFVASNKKLSKEYGLSNTFTKRKSFFMLICTNWTTLLLSALMHRTHIEVMYANC